MRWLRRLIRRHTNPIHERDAEKWKLNTSMLYAFISWNVLGYVVYEVFLNKKTDWSYFYGLKLEEEKNQRPGIYWAETLNRKTARIIRVEGFKITDDFDYVAPDEEE